MDDRERAIATNHDDDDDDDDDDDYHHGPSAERTKRYYPLFGTDPRNHADVSEESTKPSSGSQHVGSEILIEHNPEPVGIDGDILYRDQPSSSDTYDGLPVPFSFENILTNLEACEEKYYNDLFCLFDDEGTGKVSAQHMLLREALIYNSTLKEDLIDSTLSQVTDYRGEISAEDFISLARTHAADDSLSMVAFYTAGDGDDLVPGECEIALIKHANAEFNVSFDDIKWEMVMSSIIDQDLLCDDALFRRYCNHVARIVRLYNLQNLVTPT